MSTQTNILALEQRRVPSLPIVGALRNWSIGKSLLAPGGAFVTRQSMNQVLLGLQERGLVT